MAMVFDDEFTVPDSDDVCSNWTTLGERRRPQR
jgi:hypothetical protein